MPMLFEFLCITATILFTVFGQLIIKWRVSQLEPFPAGEASKLMHAFFLVFDPFIFAGIFAAFLASITWIAAVSRMELSFAYPFIALNFMLVILFSVFLFNESLTPFKILGMIFIMLGIFFTAKS